MIDRLKSTISSRRGVAAPNYYKVTLPAEFGVSGDELNLLCRGVNIPGRQIVTTDRKIGNTLTKVASDHAFDDVTLSFLVLNDYGVRKYFEQWQAHIINPSTREMGYFRDYAKPVQIAQLKKGVGFPIANIDLGLPSLPSEIQGRLPSLGPINLAQGEIDFNFLTGGDIIYECYLIDAYPTNMGQIQLADTAESSLVELTVQLTYRDWRQSSSGTGSAVSDFIQSQIGGFASRLFS